MQNYSNPKAFLILALLLSLTSQKAYAEEFSALIKNVNIILQNTTYQLDADIEYHLSPTAKEALLNGIPLSWQVQIKLQESGIFQNTTIKELSINYKIRNHALLNLYSVEKSDSNSKNMFSNLTVALNFMSRLQNIKLIEKRLLATDIKYHIVIKTAFIREALPSSLRPLSYFDSQWSLSSDWSLWQL